MEDDCLGSHTRRRERPIGTAIIEARDVGRHVPSVCTMRCCRFLRCPISAPKLSSKRDSSRDRDAEKSGHYHR